MKTSTKTALFLTILAVFDTFIPVPLTASILIYVLANKPLWFKNLVAEIYNS